MVRNGIHAKLAERAGKVGWWVDQRLTEQLLDRERRAIDDAIDTVARRIEEPSADDVVAASSFGLWVGLVSEGIPRHPLHSYETVLWQPRLRHAFPHYAGGRKQLHGELDAIRKLRNRVAYHEPIFRSNLTLIGETIARVASYIDPAGESYIRGSERLTETLAAKRAFIADGTTSF